MLTLRRGLLALGFLLCAAAAPLFAQEDELTLRLSRDFGYGGLGGDIQGTFSYRVEGPADLVRVEFLLDEQVVGEDTEPPFRFQFTTDTYALGAHTLRAVGYTAAGDVLESASVTRNFVDPGSSWEAAGRFVLPLLAIVLLAVLLPAAVAMVQERRHPTPPGAPRKYGMAGGAICPRCGRPYGRHFWAPNLVAGKLDRCPHCGKWAIVGRQSAAALRAAEQAELQEGDPDLPEPLSPEEKFRQQLDDSRFD